MCERHTKCVKLGRSVNTQTSWLFNTNTMKVITSVQANLSAGNTDQVSPDIQVGKKFYTDVESGYQ